MSAAFEIVDEESAAQWDARLRREAVAEAWRCWVVASCEESNGGHDHRLRFSYGDPSLECAHDCPWTVHDAYPDGWELIGADLAVTVDVEVRTYRGGPWGPPEYDAFVWLEARS